VGKKSASMMSGWSAGFLKRERQLSAINGSHATSQALTVQASFFFVVMPLNLLLTQSEPGEFLL